jgi:hypothetical protein
MGQLPITSRLKRVPSALKATDTPKAKVIKKGKDTTETITKTTTSEDPNLTSFKNKCGKYGGKNSAAAAADGCVWDDKAKDPEPVTTTTEEDVVVKGEDVIADTYSKRTGDVLTNFDGRQKGRATKFTNKYVRQSQNKLARSDDRMAKFKNKNMKDGVFTAPEAGQKGFKKYSRLKNKQTENTNELADFKVGASNQAESMRTGKKIGSSNVRRDVDRQDTAGDQTPEQRIAQVAAENNITTASTGQASKAINAPSAEGGKSQFDVGEIESFDPTKFGQYKSPAPKRGYAMKGKNPVPAKSVLKKSYFKNK